MAAPITRVVQGVPRGSERRGVRWIALAFAILAGVAPSLATTAVGAERAAFGVLSVSSPQFPNYDTTQEAGTDAGRPAVFIVRTTPDIVEITIASDAPLPTYRVAVTAGEARARLVPTSSGPHTVYVQAFDAAGNTGSSYTDFTIFSPRAQLPPGFVPPAHDLTSDGRPDLIRLLPDDRACLVVGSGQFDPSFAAGRGCSTTLPVALPDIKPVQIGDWDQDGRNDAAYVRPDHRICWFAGTGGGGLDNACTPVEGRFDPMTGGYETLEIPFVELYGAGDWDGDGAPDLAGRLPDGGLQVIYNDRTRVRFTPTGSLETTTIRPRGWPATAVVFPGDIDGDGHGDVLARRPDGVLVLHASLPDGSGLRPPERISAGWNAYAQIVGLGDWNGDGAVDIAGITRRGPSDRFEGRAEPGRPRFAPAIPFGPDWTRAWVI